MSRPLQKKPASPPTAASSSPDPAAVERMATRLGRVLAGGTHQVTRIVELPRVGKAAVRLLTRLEEEEVALELAAWIHRNAEEKGLSDASLVATGRMPVSSRRALEVCCRAFRDPEDLTTAFGTREEWEQLDDTILAAANIAYEDLAEELDPVGELELDAGTMAVIEAAVKKNDRASLTSFGARSLAAYAITSAARRASSEPATS